MLSASWDKQGKPRMRTITEPSLVLEDRCSPINKRIEFINILLISSNMNRDTVVYCGELQLLVIRSGDFWGFHLALITPQSSYL